MSTNQARPFTGPVTDPDYWRQLVDHLRLSEPLDLSERGTDYEGLPVEAGHFLATEGYLSTSPFLNPEDVSALARGIQIMDTAGLAHQALWIFDLPWLIMARLHRIAASLLGIPVAIQPANFDTFCVAPGEVGLAPHRDNLGPDPSIRKGGRPTAINLWVALSDAASDGACIHAVPAPFDPDYLDGTSQQVTADPRDVRALAVGSGAVIAWTTHLMHWGGRAAAYRPDPRLAFAAYFVAAPPDARTETGPDPAEDQNPPPPILPDERISFERRLALLRDRLVNPALFDAPPPGAAHR